MTLCEGLNNYYLPRTNEIIHITRRTAIDRIINRVHGSRYIKRFTLTSFYGRFAGRIFFDFVARQFCRLISQQRLRPVTLRATLSDGLPFSS